VTSLGGSFPICKESTWRNLVCKMEAHLSNVILLDKRAWVYKFHFKEHFLISYTSQHSPFTCRVKLMRKGFTQSRTQGEPELKH
jgi:hypothetical protein